MDAPSDWIRRWSHLVRPGGSVLDVACGHGRHLRWFAARGHAVTGIDRSREALAASQELASTGRVDLVEADIENAAWPLRDGDRPRRFDAVVVTNYLWRPLLPVLCESVAPGGVLLYETFGVDQAAIGRPARPEFLLRHGELLELCRGRRVVAYEEGLLHTPQRFLQRVAALWPVAANGTEAPQHPLLQA